MKIFKMNLPPKLVERVRVALRLLFHFVLWIGTGWASLYHLNAAISYAMAAEVTAADWTLVEHLGLCKTPTGNSVGDVLYHAVCATLVGLKAMATYFSNDRKAFAVLVIAVVETYRHIRGAYRWVRALIAKVKAKDADPTV